MGNSRVRALSLLLAVTTVVLGARSTVRASPCEARLATLGTPEGGAQSQWVDGIWRALTQADLRVAQGPAATLRIVDADRSGAWYCRNTDQVLVSVELIDYAWRGRASDGSDFLAFALAHELAHRRFDPRDAELGASKCPDLDLARERRADARAAFLVATAIDPVTRRGFSPFNLVRRDALATFLASELGWPDTCPALSERVAAVSEAVAQITLLGQLYDATALLRLAAPPRGPDAVPIIEALSQRVNAATEGPAQSWAAVPELELLVALTHLDRAGEVGWCTDALARAPLEPSPCALRCVPFAPSYAMLAAVDARGARHAPGLDRDLELALARRALRRAAALGASPREVAGVQVCADVLALDTAAARTQLAIVARALPSFVGADLARGLRVRAQLRDLDALIALQEALLEESAPVASDTWLDAMREHAESGALASDAAAASTLRVWLAHGTSSVGVSRTMFQPDAAPPPLTGWDVPPEASCAGLVSVSLGDSNALGVSGRCVEIRARQQGVVRFVEVPQAATSSGLGAWSARCALTLRGVGADGIDAFAARCGDEPSVSWLVFAVADRVTRVVHVEFDP